MPKLFQSFQQAINHPGTVITQDSISILKRAIVDNKTYYIKHYTAAGKRWQRFFGKSRGRTEYENLLYFTHLGIPTLTVAQFFEKRFHMLAKQTVIITAERENTADLLSIARSQSSHWQEASWRRQVLEQVAQYARKLHQQGFSHWDLHWRNILISLTEQPVVYFMDCPKGKKHYLRRQYCIQRDLRCFARHMKDHLTQEEINYFHHCYQQNH